jgi:hypothetical protein
VNAVAESLQGQRRRARTAPVAVGFLHGGGWRAVSPRSGDRCGLTAHRGVLHPDELKWLDWGRATAMVEAELGYTITELRSVYRQGPLSGEQRELRGCVDARLLALSRSGGNMTLLGRLIGFYVHNGHCQAITNALARARQRKEDESDG